MAPNHPKRGARAEFELNRTAREKQGPTIRVWEQTIQREMQELSLNLGQIERKRRGLSEIWCQTIQKRDARTEFELERERETDRQTDRQTD